MKKNWPFRQILTRMPLPRHPTKRGKELVELSINAICEVNTVLGDPAPDLEQVVLCLG